MDTSYFIEDVLKTFAMILLVQIGLAKCISHISVLITDGLERKLLPRRESNTQIKAPSNQIVS